MNKDLDLIAEELFDKIKSQFPDLELKDQDSKPADDDPKTARFFDFDYKHKGNALGRMTVSISEKDGFVVIFSNDIVGNKNDYVKKQFFNFLRELREFAKQKVMQFDIRDITKNNLEKRDYEFLSKTQFGESKMRESKLFGTAKTSYQRIGEATLIVKHNDYVNQENPAGRAQRIESIYVENSVGERFLYPSKHLNGARALACHVSHGGKPYDGIGQHITGLSEELGKLRMFKHYVERNETISEAMNTVTSKVLTRIQEVKKEIQHLQRPAHYATFAENFQESQSKEIPEDIMNDWIDRLTIRTFNEELKNVFPYIFKLVDESDIPVKELNVEDIIEDTISETELAYETDIPEFTEFESFLSNIAEGKDDLFGENNQDLIAQLNDLIAQPIPVGVDGTNAIESLTDIIQDKELEQVFKEMSDINPETDARDIIRDYIEQKDQEGGTDVLSQLNFDEENEAPEEIPAEPAAPATTAEVPAAPATAAEVPAAEPAAVPAPMTASIKHTGNRMFEVIHRAVRAGMQLEDTFEVSGRTVSLKDAITRSGMQVEDFFGQGQDMQSELVEFVKSMFNSEDGSFPKGEEGVMIACEKKFGEECKPIAEKIIGRLSSMGEMHRIKQLSGMYEENKTMSRAGKGVMKYGKDGMKALANAGREGASEQELDSIRDKYDKYDESTLSELSKKTLGSYVKAAAKDAEEAGRDQEYHGHKNDYARGEKRQKGIEKAVDRLTKENSELTAMLRIAGLK